MAIWRPAGWPCRDAVELDLIAAGWAKLSEAAIGHDSIRLTDAGIRLLAESRQRNQRSISAHDRLAERVAEHLTASGGIVWRELSLRAKVNVHGEPASAGAPLTGVSPWAEDATDEGVLEQTQGKTSWRMARPDVFSVRHTSVEAYLQPMIHEVKVSRADLLSDLRHAAKRESYRWLSCKTYYVFPAGVAKPVGTSCVVTGSRTSMRPRARRASRTGYPGLQARTQKRNEATKRDTFVPTQDATSTPDYSSGNAIAIAESFIRGLQVATNIATFETQQQLILLHLYGRGEVVQNKLIQATGVGKSSVSRNVERLGRGEWLKDPAKPGTKKHVPGLGLVTSEPDPQNRKTNLVQLTPLGKQMLDNIATAVARKFNITAM